MTASISVEERAAARHQRNVDAAVAAGRAAAEACPPMSDEVRDRCRSLLALPPTAAAVTGSRPSKAVSA